MIASIKRHKKQLVLFLIAGGLSAVIEICLMKLMSMPHVLPSLFSFENKANAYPISNFVATGIGILSNYFFNIYFVFERGKHSKRKEFSLFLLLSLATMLINWGIFGIAHSYIHEPINLGFIAIGDIVFCKAIAIFLVSAINYVVKKKLIFSN